MPRTLSNEFLSTISERLGIIRGSARNIGEEVDMLLELQLPLIVQKSLKQIKKDSEEILENGWEIAI